MESDKRKQTQRSFGDKWTRNPSLAFRQTLERGSEIQQWILNRNGFADFEDGQRKMQGYRRILDAGCGNGRVTALLAELAPQASVLGVDVVDIEPAKTNTAPYRNVAVRNQDLREPLGALGSFDFVYCQEVLHHTGDPEGAFRNLAAALAKGGKLAIYVYRRKAPAREYMDDYVRDRIAGLPYEDAMAVCRQLTELGKRLSAAGGEVEVDDIPTLGIEKGRYTPQRLLYNFFLKCYWNPQLSEEENAVVNYDWYHPEHCSRHTLPEVLAWFERSALRVTWQYQDLYGITVHGVRD